MPGMGRGVGGADQGAVGSGSVVGPGRVDLVDAGPRGAHRPGRRARARAAPRTGSGGARLRRRHRRHSSRIGRTVDVDPLELMADRARSMGLARQRVGELRGIDPPPPRRRRLDGGEPPPSLGLGPGAGLARALAQGGRRGLGPVAADRGRVDGRRSCSTGRPGSACRWPGWGSAGADPPAPGRRTASAASRGSGAHGRAPPTAGRCRRPGGGRPQCAVGRAAGRRRCWCGRAPG